MKIAELQPIMEHLIGEQPNDEPLEIKEVTSVGGGCISEAYRVQAQHSGDKPREYFVKRNHIRFLKNFECEIAGLSAIEQSDVIRVPKPLAAGVVNEHSWLILQWIHEVPKPSDFFERFGHALAELHRCTMGSEIGWKQNNYIGASEQLNQATTHWIDFFAQQRIGQQLKMARDSRTLPSDFIKQVDTVVTKMDWILQGSDGNTSLLHGDLWSGNYLCDQLGRPVLIDPAVYRGNREAEFGMLKLFGNCPPAFYDAYHETFPLAEGWEIRCQVYTLYHLLNHLNLFGMGYLRDCQIMCSRILSQIA